MLHAGKSSDGIHREIADEPIRFSCSIDEIKEFCYGYDPRVCKIEDKYYVTWCNGYQGQPTIGVAWTTVDDLTDFTKKNSY